MINTINKIKISIIAIAIVLSFILSGCLKQGFIVSNETTINETIETENVISKEDYKDYKDYLLSNSSKGVHKAI